MAVAEVIRNPMPQLSGTVGQVFGGTSSTGINTTAERSRAVVQLSAQGLMGAIPEFSATVTLTVATTEPVIPDTNIPLYRVTALLDGGMTVAQVKEDFPSLTVTQIEQARDYANVFPNYGRQYPRKSLKRLLRKSGFHRINNELTGMRGTRGVSAG